VEAKIRDLFLDQSGKIVQGRGGYAGTIVSDWSAKIDDLGAGRSLNMNPCLGGVNVTLGVDCWRFGLKMQSCKGKWMQFCTAHCWVKLFLFGLKGACRERPDMLQ
jgi:hypothetical protein